MERAKNFGIGFAVGFIITFALLYVVGVALSAVAARSAATIAAAEAETAAAEAAGQVAARLGPVIAEQTLGRLVASGTAETLAELGFGAAARAGLRTAVLRFTTQAGRQAFIRGLRREAVEALARTNVARLRLAIRELQIAIEELALEFGVF